MKTPADAYKYPGTFVRNHLTRALRCWPMLGSEVGCSSQLHTMHPGCEFFHLLQKLVVNPAASRRAASIHRHDNIDDLRILGGLRIRPHSNVI